MIQRILFELGLLWAEIIRWTMGKDPVVIVMLGFVVILVLYVILMVIAELTGHKG